MTAGRFVGTLVVLVVAVLILRSGIAMLRALAQPVAPPPPEGEMRRVKLLFRCEICGAEVRMTMAATDDPDPPRHCMEDMVLVTPVE